MVVFKIVIWCDHASWQVFFNLHIVGHSLKAILSIACVSSEHSTWHECWSHTSSWKPVGGLDVPQATEPYISFKMTKITLQSDNCFIFASFWVNSVNVNILLLLIYSVSKGLHSPLSMIWTMFTHSPWMGCKENICWSEKE